MAKHEDPTTSFKPVTQTPVGVQGVSTAPGHSGGTSTALPFAPLNGTNDGGDAVTGQTNTGTGVRGFANAGTGVSGESNESGIGVLGYSQGGPALLAQSDTAGVGLLALGSYNSEAPAKGGIGSPLSDDGADFPAAVAALLKAHAGFAAVFSGQVAVTDLLTGTSATLTGALSAATAIFTNALSAASATLTGALNTASANVTGDLIAGSATLLGALNTTSANVTGPLIATSATLGALSAASATFSGAVTASDVILTGADCAEEFDLLAGTWIEAGSVVVFADGGELSVSDLPYNKRVAGVISGAGSYRPGVVLDRHATSLGRVPIALVGKVFCKVDANYASIEVGDALTTSPTPGYAMKVADPVQAFGAVIGKALAPCRDGQSMIPILVSLQ